MRRARNLPEGGGSVGWMVRNGVTPNILMLALVLGGLFIATRIKQEVFPEFVIDEVNVTVAYPGASPEEVEQGIVLVIEEAIRSVENVKEVRATASEGSGRVTAELIEGSDRQKAYQDIQQEVARIDTFPDDAEEPEVTLNVRRRDVLEVEVYGGVDEWTLRAAAEHVRDMLLQHPAISQVDFEGARDYEIIVEVPEHQLRRFGLTIRDVADKIARTAVEVPAGKIETRGGEILLRVTERRDYAAQYQRVPIVTNPDGSAVLLEDIATIREGFEDTDEQATFNNQRRIGLEVYRIGDETPIEVAEAAREVIAAAVEELPPGIDLKIVSDRSDIYKQRLELLLKNAFFGLILVLALLTLFLEFKLAFWVTMGIPISFLGGMLFLPIFDVSINMISMFAFIIALGIVVDDAIVAGENIFEYRQRGMSLAEASIKGARDVLVPVTFSILTNIIAFLPLLLIPGQMGMMWRVVPIVVCSVFIISLVEAIWILPAHLAHVDTEHQKGLGAVLHRWQQAFSRWFSRTVERIYGPVLRACLTHRAITLAAGFSILAVTLAYIGSGRLGFVLMPKVESDVSVVTAMLPLGTPLDRAKAVEKQLITAAEAIVAENGGDKLSIGISGSVEENEVQARVYLTEPKVRPITTTQLTQLWRDRVGPITDAQSVRFESDRGGPGGGPGLTVELSHRNIATLDRASATLAQRLLEYSAISDVDDGYTPGKRQVSFRILPESESLGLTASDVSSQLRAAFQGVEAIKQQRGRSEVTVRVRRPEAERISEFDLEQMVLRTPSGGQVPLLDVAEPIEGRAYTTIDRRDGRRTVSVTADVDPPGEVTRIQTDLETAILPQLARDFPGLTYGFEGRQADMRESFDSLIQGLGLSLLGIYVLLAIPFKSYVQPVIVMAAIPFGIVGAALGHMIMGYDLSIISIMGIVALGGVVVNDSLVLIDYTNKLHRDEGFTPFEAVSKAGIRRFRPILLTTLTTFGGLAPMIFETSRQARFMIPMAISLGFGILFATVLILIIVPAMYLVIEDGRNAIARFRTWVGPDQRRDRLGGREADVV